MQPQKNFLTHPIEILYEDEWYIAFDKPPGLLVVPTPKKEENTLENIVNHQCAQKREGVRFYPCHRLDRETSGVILFAKTKRFQKLIGEAFRRHAIKKRYIAFAQGQLKKSAGEWRSRIQNLEERKFHRLSQGKLAVTRYKVLETRRQYSILEVEPVTGRTNQIRIHFSEMGHPLVGERKYAFARDYALKFRRTALHAQSLEWMHPVTHKRINVKSTLAKDMEVFRANH